MNTRSLAERVRPLVPLLLLTVLALALRLFMVGASNYYDDEVISTHASRPPVQVIMTEMIGYDTHPPGYHLLLHAWQQLFGASLVSLRLLSVLLSTLCVPLVYLLGRELAGARPGVLAAGLMAIAPFQILHAQQARMYALLTLVTLLVTLLMVQAWRRGGTWRWVALAAALVLGVYTHIYMFFSIAALDLWVLSEAIRTRRIDIRRWGALAGAHLVAGLSFLPVLQAMANLTEQVASGFWIRKASPFGWVLSLVNITANSTFLVERAPQPLILICYVCVAVALLSAIVYSLRLAVKLPEERSALLLLSISVVVPITIATIISLTIEPILLDRTVIGLSGPLFVLISWMFLRTYKRPIAQLLGGATVAAMLIGLGYYLASPRYLNDFQTIAGVLGRERQAGDAVTAADWQSIDTIALLQPTMPDLYALPRSVESAKNWRWRMRFIGYQLGGSETAADLAPRFKRIWVLTSVYTYGLDEIRTEQISWLEQHGRLIDTRTYKTATLQLFELTR